MFQTKTSRNKKDSASSATYVHTIKNGAEADEMVREVLAQLRQIPKISGNNPTDHIKLIA